MEKRRRGLNRTFSNVSLTSVDSAGSCSSLTSLESTSSLEALHLTQNLPKLYKVPSASRNAQFKKDIKSIRHNLENNYRNAVRKKKKICIHKRAMHYNDLEVWLRKHRMSAKVGGLTSSEFQSLFKWFRTRMESNPDKVRGIRVSNVVDDFVESGLFQDRAEAYSFMCLLDPKKNGQVTFDSFMAAFNETSLSDDAQLHTLKSFLSEVTPTSSPGKNQQRRAFTSHASSRTSARGLLRAPVLHMNPCFSPVQKRRVASGAQSPSEMTDTCLPTISSPIVTNLGRKKSLREDTGYS